MIKARILALYLPQYYPIQENNIWWGPGFTEWTNVGKAKKYFRGHYQPRVPADLGYYDLRVAETRQAQADMAREYGVEGFLYWHYWFGNGKRIMDRPFEEVLHSGKPDFPFALAWANHSWRGFTKTGADDVRNMLQEQLYPGIEDYRKHFYSVLPAFRDKRYITVDGKPFFLIFAPFDNPDIPVFIEEWRKLANENSLPGIYFVGHRTNIQFSARDVLNLGFDSVNTVRLLDFTVFNKSLKRKIIDKFNIVVRKVPMMYPYEWVANYFVQEEDREENIIPTVLPNWDHTPRSGEHGLVLTKSTPTLFAKVMRKAVDCIKDKEKEHRIIIIKSWNEWGESNYMEPDLKWGRGYLEALKREVID